MNGALIGFGTIAMGHLAAYLTMDNVVIKALVDPSVARRNQAKIIDPTIHTYETFDEMISNENLDFIDICSPPNTHAYYIRTGLSNHFHVLCEKPFLLSVEEYKGILPLVNSTGRVLYPSHNYKFSPILQFIQKFVHSESFGQIISGHFRTLRSGHARGVTEWKPDWRRDDSISGGGILRDHGTHCIYIACNICDNPPTAVSCILGNLRNNQFTENEDTVLLTLYFNDNNQFLIDLSWAANFRKSYYAVTGNSQSIIVENDILCRTTTEGLNIRESIPSEFDDPSHKKWFQAMFMDFIDVIANPNRQLSLLREALIVSLVIDRAYASAKQGGIILNVPFPSEEFLKDI